MAGWVALDTTGLKESLASMSKAERLDVGKQLRREFESIANSAISQARGFASTKALRRAVGTMKQASTSTGAALKFGGGFRGAFGNEYGAHQNIPRQGARGTYLGYNQFPSWRGSGETAGYAMWPGIRKAADEGVEALADAVTKILEG